MKSTRSESRKTDLARFTKDGVVRCLDFIITKAKLASQNMASIIRLRLWLKADKDDEVSGRWGATHSFAALETRMYMSMVYVRCILRHVL